ncbi:hypothetical protein NQ317_009947 [Molorchus minor]|uniref:Uncharacterized protein n=1 Tax=Molorchus minor TaxID=1323400 RepID=A0ABQ9K6J1_9CUCU|nr:hypothetical protein NQ317_009947 [Molorchus minor]
MFIFLFQIETTVEPPDPIKENPVISHPTILNIEKPSTLINPPIPINKNCVEDEASNIELRNPNIASESEPGTEIDESNVNFSQNRELWQRRANLESMPASPLLKTHRFSEPYMQRQNHTPDLVMDLPLDKASPTKSPEGAGGDSPDMQTAAETFAKQNQSITSPMLNRKYATMGSNTSTTTTTTFKPQSKTKPMVLKKPVFSVPLRSVSIEMMCKDPPDLPT